jgi:protocatechuate 3,4-dioxygenase beta subunit
MGPGILSPAVWFQGSGSYLQQHRVKEIDVPENAESFECDLALDPGQSLHVAVVGPDGRPLPGFEIRGHLAQYDSQPTRTAESGIDITSLAPGDRRFLLIHHADQQLGKAVSVEFDPNASRELTIQLEPCATVSGRIISPDLDLKAAGKARVVAVLPGAPRYLEIAPCEIDNEGRFRISGLLSGVEYRVECIGEFDPATNIVKSFATRPLAIKPGETTDLGDVWLTHGGQNQPPRNGQEKSDTKAAANPPASGGKDAGTIANGENGSSTPGDTANRKPSSDAAKDAQASRLKPQDSSRTRRTDNSVLSTEYSDPADLPANPRASRTLRGHVIDPDGKPFVGATIYILGSYWSTDVKHVPLAEVKSGADGAFEISCPDPMHDKNVWHGRMSGNVQTIAAIADGFGPGFVDSIRAPGDEPLTLRLVRDDVPINGQVLDLEGRPVPGVRIKVGDILPFKGEDLTEWLESVRSGESRSSGRNRLARGRIPAYESAASLDAVTDADGRFRLRGIGRERAAEVVLEGPTIARTEATIVTRRIPTMVETAGPDFAKRVAVLGADCQVTVMPTRPIVGTVRDAETGQPLAGVTIVNSSWVPGVAWKKLVRSVTDQQGRYQLMGLPKVKGIEIAAVPNDEQPYFEQEAEIPESIGLNAVMVDFNMHRGFWITGRVTDKVTGAPVAARVYYTPFRANEYAQKRTPEFEKDGNIQGFRDDHATRADGTYRLVGLPGRAILGAAAILRPYRVGAGADVIQGLDKSGHFPTYQMQMGPKWPNSLVEINPPAGIESFTCDVQLDAVESVHVSVIDPNSQPVTGYTVEGQRALFGESLTPHQQPAFDATNFGPDETRTLIIQHEPRKLGRVVQMRVDAHPNREAQIKLEPLATVSGRLLTGDGDPLAGVALRFGVHPGGDFGKELRGAVTDKEGRFSQAVLSGCNYSVMAEGKAILAAGLDYGFFVVRETLSIKPGETIDLGDVSVAQPKPPATPPLDRPVNRERTARPPDQQSDTAFNYSGTVVDDRGQPVAGAKIEFDFWRKAVPPGDVPPAAVSDEQGKFHFSRKKSDFADRGDSLGHAWAVLVATKEGYGFAAGLARHFETTGRLDAELTPQQRRNLAAFWGTATNVLSMVPDDVPVHGRIVNTEGQPVAGAKIEAVCIWGGKDGTLDAWEAAARKSGANYYTAGAQLRQLSNGHFQSEPRAVVVSPVLSDADGWFTLKGLGRERIAETFVSGPGIETQMIHVRTRRGDVITLPGSERSDPGRGDPVFYPAEFTRVVGPSVAVAGQVTDSRTKQPLPGVTLQADRIATSSSGGSFEAAYIRTVTDADGRYRLEGLPLGKNEFVALPATGSRNIPAGFTVNTSAGSKPLTQDIRLTAGVVVRGRVIDGRTKQPLAGHLEYFVYSNNPHLQEAQGFARAHLRYHYWSSHEGLYEIPVLPGKGILAFTASDHQQFPRGAGADRIDAPSAVEKGSELIFRTQPSACIADNHHLLTALDPLPGTAELTIDLTLTSGVNIPGRVLAPDGQALGNYCILGDVYGGWNSNKSEAFEIKAYLPQEGRRLAFYHPGRNLVGQHDLNGEPPQKLEITLGPGATLVGRVLDADGTPLENAEIHDASLPDREMDRNLAAKDRQRGMLPPDADGRPARTDAQGRFELRGIIPGLRYSAQVSAATRENGTTSHCRCVVAKALDTPYLPTCPRPDFSGFCGKLLFPNDRAGGTIWHASGWTRSRRIGVYLAQKPNGHRHWAREVEVACV